MDLGPCGWVGLAWPKMNPPPPKKKKTTSIATAFKNCTYRRKLASESHAGMISFSFSQFFTFTSNQVFVWGGGVTKPQKRVFLRITFNFTRNLSGTISESPGLFGIEQAQQIIGPKLRCRVISTVRECYLCDAQSRNHRL